MPSTPLPRWAHTNILLYSQDLKQQKFVIEAEPSELVCIPNLALSTSFPTFGHLVMDPCPEKNMLTIEGIDLRCEGKNCKGKGMGGCAPKADLFRFVC
jgi:hypothetical protein